MEPVSGVDAIVVGAGAIGCTVAWRLAQAGARVALVDRGETGGEASSAAAGIIGAQMEAQGPGPLLSLQVASRALYPKLADELRELTGINVRCRIEGILQQAFSPEEFEKLRARAAWQREAGLHAEWFESQSSVHQSIRELGGSPAALAALYAPDDGQIDNRLLVSALRLAALRAGVSFLRADARAVLEGGGRIRGVELLDESKSVGRLDGRAVVVAAGAWSALLPGARIAEGAVRPIRGQMIAIAATIPSGRVLTGGGGYAVPRADRVFIGATAEDVGFQKQVTTNGLRGLLATAARLLPDLGDVEVLESWSGLRPGSRDGLPLLGKPERGPDGLFVCSGHFRSGILMTPITGELMRDVVLGRPPTIDLTPFRPDRF